MINWRLNKDLSDLFHPILVKEVRQGIRARSFVLTFIAIHVTMIFLLMGMVGTVSGNDAHTSSLQGWNFFFWAVVFVPLLIILPLLGFGTIYREIEQQTGELLFLTHLSSRGIVLGKWLALATQALLFTVAIVPYFTLRFFLGGVDLVQEFTILLYLFLGSLLLIGLGLIVSPITNRFLRILFIIGYLLGLLIFFQIAAFILLAGELFGTIADRPNMWILLGLILPGVMALLLEYAAQSIAPEAENHTFAKRLIGILLAGLLLGLAYGGAAGEEFYMAAALVMIGWIVLDALAEPPLRTMGALRIYQRFSSFRFLARWTLYPGWPQSMIFATLAFAAIGPLFWEINMNNEEALILFVLFIGFYFFSFAVLYGFSPNCPTPVRFVFILGIFQYLFGAMLNLTTLTPAMPDLTILGTIVPGAVFAYMTIDGSVMKVSDYFLPLAASTVIAYFYLWFRGRLYRQQLRDMESVLERPQPFAPVVSPASEPPPLAPAKPSEP